MIEAVPDTNLSQVLPLIRQYQEFYQVEDINDDRNRTFFAQSGARSAEGCQFLFRMDSGKVFLFYIAFLPSFMDLSVLQIQDIVIACILCLSGLMIGLMSVAYSAAWARTYFRSTEATTRLNRVAGSSMMSAGVYMGTRAA